LKLPANVVVAGKDLFEPPMSNGDGDYFIPNPAKQNGRRDEPVSIEHIKTGLTGYPIIFLMMLKGTIPKDGMATKTFKEYNMNDLGTFITLLIIGVALVFMFYVTPEAGYSIPQLPL